MKRLYLTFARLKAYFMADKLIFVFYCIGVLLTVFSMITVYITAVSAKKYDESDGYYIYTLYSDSGKTFSLSSGNDMLKNAGINENSSIQWSGYSTSINETAIRKDGSEVKLTLFPLVVYNGIYCDLSTGTVDLFAEDISDGIYPVIVPSNIASLTLGANPVGEVYNIYGIGHSVAAVHNNNIYYLIIRPDDPCGQRIEYNTIVAAFSRPLDDETVQKLKEYGNELFDDAILNKPGYTPAQLSEKTFISNLMMIAGFCAIAMLAFTFLLKAMLQSRAAETAIMSVCGASKLYMCMSVIRDAFVLNTLAAILSLALFELIRMPVMSKIVVNPVMKFSDYLIIFICFTAVGLLICTPLMVSYMSGSVAKVRRRYLK